jgi:hypothetical protein
MLERVMSEIPKLTDAVVEAELEGDPSHDIGKTGAADAMHELASDVQRTARNAQTDAKRTAQQASKPAAVEPVEGQIKVAVGSEEDLAIARYDSLTAEEIASKLPGLSQIDLAKLDSHERKNDNRSTVLSCISALRYEEPWPGYDELTVAEIEAVLSESEEQHADVVSYERAHKNRAGVLNSAQHEAANA